MELKLFKILFWIGIVTLIIIHISPMLNLFEMTETNLVSWSYFWVFLITYGGSGWFSYKKMKGRESNVQMIPIITSCSSMFLLLFFNEEIP